MYPRTNSTAGMRTRIPIGNGCSYVPIINGGRRAGSVYVVPWHDASNAASYIVDAADYMLKDYLRVERIPDWRGNRVGVVERIHVQDDVLPWIRKLKVDRENMASIVNGLKDGTTIKERRHGTVADLVLEALDTVHN